MQNKFLPFSKPCINQAAIDEVVACIESGWLTTGPRVKAFESELASYLAATNVLAVNSATSGLHLALKSLDIGLGDEVITTPFTFVATLNTIVHAGAKPVLVDACLDTYNIDVTQIEDAITEKTKAIMPVHFAGIPVDLDPIYAIAEKYNLRVIEDAAQAIGSHYKGRVIGSFGDTQVFSFHANKTITTGEGGCITTSDQDLAKKANVLRFHGIDREAWNRNSKEGSQHYDVIDAGFKYNMMDIQAALGLHQLQELELFIEKRKLLAERYNAAFAKWDVLRSPMMPAYNIRHSWYIYTPLLNPEAAGISRDDFIQKMKEKDIGVGYHYLAAHLFSYYRDRFGYKQGQFPNAEFISERIMTLPLFPDMTMEDQDRVIAAMSEILKEKKR
jgi:dTDP-4-amino-4,6-dideoxygalactose transaminase